MQDFDSHVAIQARLVRFIDLSHSASPQAFYDAIFTDRFAN
jgi:hypothetical protein